MQTTPQLPLVLLVLLRVLVVVDALRVLGDVVLDAVEDDVVLVVPLGEPLVDDVLQVDIDHLAALALLLDVDRHVVVAQVARRVGDEHFYTYHSPRFSAASLL